uniref:Uncharacterized protein n=1 Tax=Apiotrichum gamsii TaxID=1105092 RepID=A0A8K1ZR75_9TREE|nr:hypothetical protein [Apiotrichum gamsii]
MKCITIMWSFQDLKSPQTNPFLMNNPEYYSDMLKILRTYVSVYPRSEALRESILYLYPAHHDLIIDCFTTNGSDSLFDLCENAMTMYEPAQNYTNSDVSVLLVEYSRGEGYSPDFGELLINP